jgi:RecJ-like exonuclease
MTEERQMITCCKCHGKGVYGVPIFGKNEKWNGEYKIQKCEVCKGTGKISLAFYEDLQRGCRR